MTTEKKVKAGVYLESEFYLKLRIWLLEQLPRIGFSEYGEIAIREKFERDTAKVDPLVGPERKGP